MSRLAAAASFRLLFLFWTTLLGASSLLFAQESSPSSTSTKAERQAQREAIIKGLHYEQGGVSISDGLAKLNVPGSFRFLGPDDANKVLHDLWGNPPDKDVLGLVLPSHLEPDSPDCWAVVIDYQEEGYIKDDDADKINYNDLLAKMKEGSHEANEKRVKEGYPSIQLVGWAEPPSYDKATKKMYWAKDLKVEGTDEDTLNYNIRILGRRGVLNLNAVAGMSQLAEIKQATPEILRMVEFNQGHRYADFNPKTDKVAAYGIAALVVGGIAAKAGLFKVLLGALLAAKKFVIIGVAASAAWLKRLFKSGREERS